MPRSYAPFAYAPTPYILAAFFALMVFVLIGANMYSRSEAHEAAQAAHTPQPGDYVAPADEPAVADATVEKS